MAKPDSTDMAEQLNHLTHQEAPTLHIIPVQFFDATWLHVQVSHITSSSFIWTAITKCTTTIELMQHQRREMSYQCL